MTFSGYFSLWGKYKSWITNSHWRHAFPKNLLKKLTSKQYITFVIKATTHPRRKIYSLTIQLHYVKISAKSNKGQENQTKLEFVIDTSLKCLSKHGHPKTQTADGRPQTVQTEYFFWLILVFAFTFDSHIFWFWWQISVHLYFGVSRELGMWLLMCYRLC